jgi:polycystin 1L2
MSQTRVHNVLKNNYFLIKIKKETCQPNKHVNKIVSSCTSEYSSFTQDQRSFDIKWQTNSNSSISSSLYNINILNAFKYTKSSDLNSNPYRGKVNTYLGGGYVFKMMMIRSNETTLENQTKALQNLSWLNEQTSAIFLEFTLFNPNVNLFQHCLFLFEITSGGNIVKSSQLTPVNLFDLNDSSLISLKIIMYLIYMTLVCILIVTETRDLLKSKWTVYFRNAYNYFDLCIIGFSWAAFSIYLYRLYSAYEINDTLKRNDKSKLFINFQYTASCQILFDFLMGSCVFFASLRFIKIFRFNRRVIIFVHAFKNSLSELVSFGLIFIIAWMSFVQAFYILLNTEAKEFASIFDSMATCFQIILGKFNSQAFADSKSGFLLAPLLFVAYNVAIVFLLINILVAILLDSYEIARSDPYLDQVDPDMFAYIKETLYSLIPFIDQQATKKKLEDKNKPIYIGFTQTFEKRVDNILEKIKKVIFLSFYFLLFIPRTKRGKSNQKKN